MMPGSPFRLGKRNRRRRGATRTPLLARLAGVLENNFRSVLAAAGCIVTSSLVLWSLAWVLDRPISQVEVAGQLERVARVQIEEAVAPFRGAGFLSVDLHALRSALESIPWVDHARVERRWPSGVRVLLTEHVPAARVARSNDPSPGG
ncbi:MAG: hypothetical protein DIU71_15040 [Proteobacteria bacterium]|nr:MAG: hypothetical protein DIU71_15040 [Pseudomonadota bacterium]